LQYFLIFVSDIRCISYDKAFLSKNKLVILRYGKKEGTGGWRLGYEFPEQENYP